MNKTFRLIIALSVIMMATTACKTKQKVTKIPSGANIEASAPKVAVTPSTEVSTPISIVESSISTATSNATSTVTEVVRNENFSLAAGETNTDILKYKYHVVVGSFGDQANAKRLQTTLNNEGNKAAIVVNEKGMFRVLIASFNDYNEAHARIKEIAARFADAWVLVQK